MCSGVLRKTVFTEHSLTLHQEMPLESLSRKEKAVLCGDAGEFSRPELISDGLKHSVNVCWGEMSPCFSFLGGHRVLSPKDEREQTSVLLLGCISASGMGDLHSCEGNTVQCKMYDPS
ncbi:hypothetical protein R3I93_020994 [Phoxinus phoxinus]|uniref:Uncharacterized protein n=1 Tax=Phoxinus phoxinus TaxID=58324 RepID=A0AAN9C932_9TELE